MRVALKIAYPIVDLNRSQIFPVCSLINVPHSHSSALVSVVIYLPNSEERFHMCVRSKTLQDVTHFVWFASVSRLNILCIL
jgi:hypothetical protein